MNTKHQTPMRSLLDQFNRFRESQTGARLSRMQGFLKKVSKHTVSTVRFNIFSVCGVKHYEVKNSSILAWFLNPAGGHGQGNLFLKSLLTACDIELPAPDSYRVRTEQAGPNAITDIVVFKKHEFLLFIENKVFASEQKDQIDREFKDMQRLGQKLGVPVDKQIAVFLTPDERKPTSGDASNWIPLSYTTLASAFEKAVPEITNHRVIDVVKDWTEHVRQWRYTNATVG